MSATQITESTVTTTINKIDGSIEFHEVGFSSESGPYEIHKQIGLDEHTLECGFSEKLGVFFKDSPTELLFSDENVEDELSGFDEINPFVANINADNGFEFYDDLFRNGEDVILEWLSINKTPSMVINFKPTPDNIAQPKTEQLELSLSNEQGVLDYKINVVTGPGADEGDFPEPIKPTMVLLVYKEVFRLSLASIVHENGLAVFDDGIFTLENDFGMRKLRIGNSKQLGADPLREGWNYKMKDNQNGRDATNMVTIGPRIQQSEPDDECNSFVISIWHELYFTHLGWISGKDNN